MRTRSVVMCFGALAVLGLLTLRVMASDMIVGIWKLNVAKSKYSPGPPPQSATVKVEAVDGGIKLVADGAYPQATKAHAEYTAKYDGKDYPTNPLLDGKPNPAAADMASWKKIDDYTYETTLKLKGKTLGVSRVVISKDGKTLTTTTTGTDAQGQKINDTAMFEKQ